MTCIKNKNIQVRIKGESLHHLTVEHQKTQKHSKKKMLCKKCVCVLH